MSTELTLKRVPLAVILVALAVSTRIAVSQTVEAVGKVNAAAPTTGTLHLQFQDAKTGIGIKHVEIMGSPIDNAAPTSLQSLGNTGDRASIDIKLVGGQEYALEFRAEGYTTDRNDNMVFAGNRSELTDMVEPLKIPDAIVAAKALIRPGSNVIYGYAYNAVSLVPLAGVKVSVKGTRYDARSDEQGFFSLIVPGDPIPADPAEIPDPSTLRTVIASLPGYKTYVLKGLDLPDGSYSELTMDMKIGQGEIVSDDDEDSDVPRGSSMTGEDDPDDSSDIASPPARSTSLQDWLDHRDQSETVPTSEAMPQMYSPQPTQLTSVVFKVPLPSKIIVGLGCYQYKWPYLGKDGKPVIVNGKPKEHQKTICPTNKEYNLEEYVATGLQNEWYSSWDVNSLKAGAVAYRSYGAYYALHPMHPAQTKDKLGSWDICDSTACQVFMTKEQLKLKHKTVETSTSDAAVATAGIVISTDGKTPAKTEYAADTSGQAVVKEGCQDGYTGDQTAQWPCMPDALSAGAVPAVDKNGEQENNHGRGMSQRGSERWATGRMFRNTTKSDYLGEKVTTTTPWQCILDHYYNDSGNSIGVRRLAGSISESLFFPHYSPDGRFIVYTDLGAGVYKIMNADGSSPTALSLSGTGAVSTINASTCRRFDIY